MVVIRAAVWYNKGVKIKAYQGFWDFSRGFSAVPPVPLLRHIALEWGSRGPEFESQHSDQLEQTLCVCSNFLRVERTHFVAPPFQITTAVPGCDLVPPLRGVFRT
jgi:hypothetical protein